MNPWDGEHDVASGLLAEENTLIYKLVALDLDGTLLPFRGAISTRTKQAIRRSMDAGIVAVLASGRPFPSLQPYVEELAITAPVIANQGCQIVLPDTLQMVYDVAIPFPAARQLLDYLQPRDLDVIVDIHDDVFVRASRFAEEFFDGFIGRRYHLTDDLNGIMQEGPAKVLVIDEKEGQERLLPELQERFGDQIHFIRAHPMFIEAIPLGVTKATALERVTGDLGVSQEQTIAIGDGDNDIEMVAWAGLGVAMGNASPGLMAVADHVALSVDEDGAAVAIETFCLNAKD